MRNTITIATLIVALVSCGQAQDPSKEGLETSGTVSKATLEGFVSVDRLPTPTDPVLLAGRSIWEGTCQGCHALGIASSPKITDRDAWAPRIAQGKDVLYQHAIEGHFGADGAMMPPRGGNDSLTDEEVKSAVDFMVANSS